MFENREQAGRLLAGVLASYKAKKNTMVLGIPRGGVMVAAEIARKLKLPLDVLVIKKLGYPGNEELALGAVSSTATYLDDAVASFPQDYLQQQIATKQQEAAVREKSMRGKKEPLALKGRTIIIVDDGIATGATIFLALRILQAQAVRKIIVAVPIATPGVIQRMEELGAEVVCLEMPQTFFAIGEFYHDFREVREEEVRRVLRNNYKSA